MVVEPYNFTLCYNQIIRASTMITTFSNQQTLDYLNIYDASPRHSDSPCFYSRVNRKMVHCFNSIFNQDTSDSLQDLTQNNCAFPSINQLFISQVEVSERNYIEYLESKYSNQFWIEDRVEAQSKKARSLQAKVISKAKLLFEKSIERKDKGGSGSKQAKANCEYGVANKWTDLQSDRDEENQLNETLDGLIKGKYNFLTKEEDFYSQVILASQLLCTGQPEDIDVQTVSKSLTNQIKRSQEIRPSRHYGNYYNFSRFNRALRGRNWKRRSKNNTKKNQNLEGETQEQTYVSKKSSASVSSSSSESDKSNKSSMSNDSDLDDSIEASQA